MPVRQFRLVPQEMQQPLHRQAQAIGPDCRLVVGESRRRGARRPARQRKRKFEFGLAVVLALIAVLAALPIMIAGLGFGQLASIIAVVAGTLAALFLSVNVLAYLGGGLVAMAFWRRAALRAAARAAVPRCQAG